MILMILYILENDQAVMSNDYCNNNIFIRNWPETIVPGLKINFAENPANRSRCE